MEQKSPQRFFVVAGICAILWPLLSELAFYSLYPLLAAEARLPTIPRGLDDLLQRMALLGQNPSILALEWSKVAVQLLLLPFFLCLHQVLAQKGQRNLTLLALGLGYLSVAFSMLAHTLNPSLNHALGQAYVEAGSEAAQTAILGAARGWSGWHLGLNQTASFLYQGCVGLIGLALIRARTWRFWGWLGLLGALVALPAKIPLGWQVPTNFVWTGIGYFVWPVGLGINLIKARRVLQSEKVQVS